jgi:hypothetical protein
MVIYITTYYCYRTGNKPFTCVILDSTSLKFGHHDIQHNDTQHNDIHHNYTQQKGFFVTLGIDDIKHK